MKYMTFNSSCAYAGLANLLSLHGFETEDREIALDMDLPYLFDREDGAYLSGPMLQGARWMNLYLKPRGFVMTEQTVERAQLCDALRALPCAMLGLRAAGQGGHAVVYTGFQDGAFHLINNKWADAEDEPDTLTLSEEELLSRAGETVTVATLEKADPEPVALRPLLEHAEAVLLVLRAEIGAFCAEEQPVDAVRAAMDTLFRAILLDGVTMLDLAGETRLSRKLKPLQRQLLDAVKEAEGGAALRLDQRHDVPALQAAISDYAALVHAHQ